MLAINLSMQVQAQPPQLGTWTKMPENRVSKSRRAADICIYLSHPSGSLTAPLFQRIRGLYRAREHLQAPKIIYRRIDRESRREVMSFTAQENIDGGVNVLAVCCCSGDTLGVNGLDRSHTYICIYGVRPFFLLSYAGGLLLGQELWRLAQSHACPQGAGLVRLYSPPSQAVNSCVDWAKIRVFLQGLVLNW